MDCVFQESSFCRGGIFVRVWGFDSVLFVDLVFVVFLKNKSKCGFFVLYFNTFDEVGWSF